MVVLLSTKTMKLTVWKISPLAEGVRGQSGSMERYGINSFPPNFKGC